MVFRPVVIPPVTRTISRSTDQNISSLLTGTAWASHILSYSFPTSGKQFDSNYPTLDPQNLSVFNAQQRSVTVRAFAEISSFANLAFTPTTETTTNHATLRFANSSLPATSYGFYPSESSSGGDVWIGTGTPEDLTPGRGQYGSTTIMHELGHALGLKHGNETSGFGATNASHNDTEYSIMNYNSYIGSPYTDQFITNAADSFPQTYMMDDIAALQFMYGAKFDSATRNAVYSWSQATGEEFINGRGQGAPSGGKKIYQTIWDGGGNITYNLANFSQGTFADMRPGQFMRFSDSQLANLDIASGTSHFARGNVYNALQYQGDKRSLIANIVTGSGNDTIVGNDGGNNIDAGAGNNLVYAGAGTNRIKVGNGQNTVYGGNGLDVITGDAGSSKGNVFWSGAGGRDTLIGGGGDDVLHGTGSDYSDVGIGKYLAGAGGNDIIFGGSGADTIFGGDATMKNAGNNTLYGNAGNDLIYGGDGADFMQGGTGSDYLVGGSGTETFYTAKADMLAGDLDRISGFHRGDLIAFSRDLASLITVRQSGADTFLTTHIGSGTYTEDILNTSAASVTAALRFV